MKISNTRDGLAVTILATTISAGGRYRTQVQRLRDGRWHKLGMQLDRDPFNRWVCEYGREEVFGNTKRECLTRLAALIAHDYRDQPQAHRVSA